MSTTNVSRHIRVYGAHTTVISYKTIRGRYYTHALLPLTLLETGSITSLATGARARPGLFAFRPRKYLCETDPGGAGGRNGRFSPKNVVNSRRVARGSCTIITYYARRWWWWSSSPMSMSRDRILHVISGALRPIDGTIIIVQSRQ